MQEITIKRTDANQRLDKFLKKYFKEATGGFLYKMLRKKNITLNKKKADGTEMLCEGDRIFVFFSKETFDKMRGGVSSDHEYARIYALSHEILILYEDNDILVLNKPAGMLSQKAKESDVSMNEYVLSYLMHSGALSEEDFRIFRPSIANRLDRNTSGILLAGKNLPGQQMLSQQLASRDLVKKYRCVVKGQLKEAGHLIGYLKKDDKKNLVSINNFPVEGAKEIQTAYEPLVVGADATLLEVHLLTGRSHQIRAHLASIGHPLAGDPKYGDASWNAYLRKNYQIHTQLLHAYSVTFLDGRTFLCEEPAIYRKVVEGTCQPGIHADFEVPPSKN